MAVLGCIGALAVAGAGGQLAAASVPSHAGSVQGRAGSVLVDNAVARPATAAATAKFLLHAGIAYYVFNHYIWKPFRAGDLHGFTHLVTIAKAALAAVFVYHEAKLMIADVKDSRLLSFLATPITAVIGKLSSLKSAVTGGNLNAVSGINGQLGTIQSQAGGKGVAIKEITHAL